MPLDQAVWLPLIDVCDYGEVLHLAPVGKQILLAVANPDGEIAQRLRVFLLALFPRHKIHFRAFSYLLRMRVAVRIPRRFGYLLDRLMQRRTHPRTDSKSYRTARSIRPVLIPQPVDKVTFVARRISTEIIRSHGLQHGDQGAVC